MSREEDLTRRFYQWEKRGRGWQVWADSVEIEPPFRPFEGHLSTTPPTGRADDAATPNGLRLFLAGLGGAGASRSDVPPNQADEPLATRYVDGAEVIELSIVLPRDETVHRDSVERFLLALRYQKTPFAFEVIGTAKGIRIQFACREPAAPVLEAQLRAYFPSGVVRRSQGWLAERFLTGMDDVDPADVVIDFGLAEEFMLPLAGPRGFDIDPLIALTAAMSDLRGKEVAALQVLFAETSAPWADHAQRACSDGQGGSFFRDAPHFSAAAKEKFRKPLFAAIIRLAVRTESEERSWHLGRALAGAFAQLGSPEGNHLLPLENDGYPDAIHLRDVLRRQTRRSGMLINSDELVSLVHPPSASVKSDRLEREAGRTKAAPSFAIGRSIILGTNTHNAETTTVGLTIPQRLRHMYVIGSSGTGKSTLLLNMILQDMRAGRGVGVLDPHGDLIDQILSLVPEDRVDDVVLLDATDEAYPAGFNVLTAHSEIEKNLLSSDLVAVFRRLSTTWGDQMTSVLGNAIMAFLDSTRGGTLADMRKFLVEPDFREEFLRSVKDPEIAYYWNHEFPVLTGRPQAPLLTRLDTFLRTKLIRHMVNQRNDRLDFRRMMDGRKIFLAKLSQGAIGEENAYLLGTLIVTRFHQMALGRQDTPEADRTPFFLYIDEFHNFITPSIASILSGARKFGLGLVLSHQELRQIFNHNADVASAVIANPLTRICFRLGDDDAKRLQSGFSFFGLKDLQSLGVGEAIVRMERAEADFNLKTEPLPPVDAEEARRLRERLVAQSRERYARKREDVERDLAAARGDDRPQKPQPPQRPPRRFGPPRKR